MTAWSGIGHPDEAVLRAFRRKPVVKKTARYLGYFILGLATASGSLFSGIGPFGIAAAAAAGAELTGLVCLSGAVLGYSMIGGVFGSLRYIATVFMVFTVGFFTRGTKVRASRWFMPAAATVLTAATGALYTELAAGGVPVLSRLFLETVLAGGCSDMFCRRRASRPRRRRCGAASVSWCSGHAC